MGNKIQHLGMILEVINRQSIMSSAKKGMSALMISAILVFSALTNHALLFIAYFPAIIFWGLDGIAPL